MRSRYVDSECVLAGNSWEEFERALLDLVLSLRPDVLLPLGTHSALAASRNRSEFSRHVALCVPPVDAFLAAFDKRACMAKCRRLAIPCPKVYTVQQAIECLERNRDAEVVVKPAYDAGAAAGIRYPRTPAELKAAVAECTKGFGAPLIEEYIPGGVEAVGGLTVLFSRQSRLVASFAVRKTAQWPLTGGLMAAGVSIRRETLLDRVLPFFEEGGWCGPAEVEFKFDRRDGQDKVIEINPRFPGYLRFAPECGVNLPVLAVRSALSSECQPLPAYTVGASYVNPGLLLRTKMADAFSGEWRHAIGNLPQEMGGALRTLCQLVDDPLPFAARLLTGRGAGTPMPVLASEENKRLQGD
jgi:predicted ATP-grasp superfamily ATP-dependent carboligase